MQLRKGCFSKKLSNILTVTSPLAVALIAIMQQLSLLSKRQLDYILTYSKVRFYLFCTLQPSLGSTAFWYCTCFQKGSQVCTDARVGQVVKSWSLTGLLMYSSSSPIPQPINPENQTVLENKVIRYTHSQALLLSLQLFLHLLLWKADNPHSAFLLFFCRWSWESWYRKGCKNGLMSILCWSRPKKNIHPELCCNISKLKA